MDGRRWEAVIEQLVGELQCASCRNAYGRTALAIAGVRDGYHFVRCRCERCGSEAIAVVAVREVVLATSAARDERPPMTEDDVLDAAALLEGEHITLRDLGIAA